MSEGVPPPDRRTPGESGPDDAFDLESGESETAPRDERTPKEWREKLLGSVGKLLGIERTERLDAYLGERLESLHEKAEEYGPKAVEAVGSVVERYNKLNWKTKLAVTGALMLGVSSTAVALPLVSGALTAALYGQRLLGAAGLGMNKRKKLDAKIAANPEHWMANKSELVKNAYAVALAAVYMAGTSFIVHEGVEQLRSLGISDWFSGASDAPDTEPSHTGSVTETPDNTVDTPSVAEQDTVQPEPSAPTSGESASQADVPVPAESTDAASAVPEETSTNTDVKPIDAKPDGSLAAKEFGAEYAAPETVPEDLSAKEWGAEYAEPVNHTGAPDWRAEHTESDFAPETPAEAPASAEVAPQAPIPDEVVTAPDAVPEDVPETPTPAEVAPQQPEASHAPAPAETSHFVVNVHGISVDPDHANAYLDMQGNRIIYGGSLDAKAEMAKQLVAKDHSAIVFFESTRPEKFLGLFEREVPHLSMAQWVDAGAESGVRIAEDTNDPSLIGIMLPTANDLAQTYKPAN